MQLREQGARHDLVDAVFSLKDQDDLVLVVRRVEALAALLATEDGQNLVAGYKRAANILRIEEKRDGVSYDGPPDETLYILPEEVALALAITDTKEKATAPSRRKILLPPCVPWPVCGRMLMPSSTRYRQCR